MSTRSASAYWEGNLKAGNGRTKFHKFDEPYTYGSRFQESSGTNPEELIAAAIASCYAMALADDLDAAGFKADRVDASAKVQIHPKVGGGFQITNIDLDVTAKVPGVDPVIFQDIANGTRRNCPVAKALAVEVMVNAKLV